MIKKSKKELFNKLSFILNSLENRNYAIAKKQIKDLMREVLKEN